MPDVELTDGDWLRFDSKWRLDPATGCHVWSGCSRKGGYGSFWVRGKVHSAHRLVLGLATGEPGLACHRCDNPSCVNPEHLFVGSQSENMKDCFSKGRGRITPRRKFSDSF